MQLTCDVWLEAALESSAHIDAPVHAPFERLSVGHGIAQFEPPAALRILPISVGTFFPFPPENNSQQEILYVHAGRQQALGCDGEGE